MNSLIHLKRYVLFVEIFSRHQETLAKALKLSPCWSPLTSVDVTWKLWSYHLQCQEGNLPQGPDWQDFCRRFKTICIGKIMLYWFRLLLLYLGPRSLFASAATPCTCGGRHQWYQDQVAILQVFADVLKFLQPTWHSLLNVFNYSDGGKHLRHCVVRCVEYISRKLKMYFSQHEWSHRSSWLCQVCGNNFKTLWDT